MKPRRAFLAPVCLILACALFAEATGATTGSLLVEANVQGTEVYLDGTLEGKAPLLKTGLAPGYYRITAMKDGYGREAKLAFVTADEKTTVRFDLHAVAGTLTIRNLPGKTPFTVIADGTASTSPTLALSEGIHSVTVRAFGYADRTVTVTIGRDAVTEIDGALEREAFSASSLSVSKRSFNPRNPALLGSVVFYFTVSAPGEGVLVITNAGGVVVRSFRLGPFDERNQSIEWNGRGDAGDIVADGRYEATLAVTGEDGTKAVPETVEVRVDGSIAESLAATGEPLGSTGPVVSATLPAPGEKLLNIEGSYTGTGFGPALTVRAAPASFLEAGVRGSLAVAGDSSSMEAFSCGIKAGRSDGNLRTALALEWKARTSNPDGDASADRQGISLSPAISCAFGVFEAGFAPSVAFGDELGFMNRPSLSAGAGVSLRLSARNASAGVWATANSCGMKGAGLSIQFAVPATNLLLCADGAWKQKNGETSRIEIKSGLGILF